MKIRLVLFVLAILFSGALTSCSINDDEIVNPTVITETGGDEIDDPAEPDEED
jgi:hypothetical protein|tara:strand:- start:861 stop:1019 length:159 start_codon:yes stop_codon:yes gene_type:complete